MPYLLGFGGYRGAKWHKDGTNRPIKCATMILWKKKGHRETGSRFFFHAPPFVEGPRPSRFCPVRLGTGRGFFVPQIRRGAPAPTLKEQRGQAAGLFSKG